MNEQDTHALLDMLDSYREANRTQAQEIKRLREQQSLLSKVLDKVTEVVRTWKTK